MIALFLGLALAAPEPLEVLTEELDRASALALPEAPPLYHLRYRLLDLERLGVETSLGAVVHRDDAPLRRLFVEVRVGTPDFDNTGLEGWQNGFRAVDVALEPTEPSLRTAVWRVTDRAYKEAVEQYARKQSEVEVLADYPGDYTLTGPQRFDGGHARAGDREALVDVTRAVSRALVVPLPEGVHLEQARAFLGHEAGSMALVDTEGTRLRVPSEETTLRAVLHLRAADGMLLTDQRLWTVRRPSQLPSLEVLTAEAREMAEHLAELALAPPFEGELVGPVLFEGAAAVDLQRYLLLPQLQGTPPNRSFGWLSSLDSGALGAARLGRRVLPRGWEAVEDPTADPTFPGASTHDVEGSPVLPARLVRDGLVRDLLMSRVPRRDLQDTNGHARGLGDRAQGRPSVVTVSPPQSLGARRLRREALRAATAYDQTSALLVRRLQEPAAMALTDPSLGHLGEGPALPPPVAVYRLHPDGTEEPLRGAQFTAVERFVLRDLLASGPLRTEPHLAAHHARPYAMSATGGLPTLVTAPDVLVGELELVARPGDPSTLPRVPPPPLHAREDEKR